MNILVCVYYPAKKQTCVLERKDFGILSPLGFSRAYAWQMLHFVIAGMLLRTEGTCLQFGKDKIAPHHYINPRGQLDGTTPECVAFQPRKNHSVKIGSIALGG